MALTGPFFVAVGALAFTVGLVLLYVRLGPGAATFATAFLVLALVALRYVGGHLGATK